MNDFKQWLRAMPKAELHLHIDGSLQASRLLQLAAKNGVEIPYDSVESVEQAYNFDDLQSFLDLYYLGASVLRDEEDFYYLMKDYLDKCCEQNIVHTEIMVEPQTYLPYGVAVETVLAGFCKAIAAAKAQNGQSALMILSLLRHLSEEEALAMLDSVEPFRNDFVGIGLASSELGNPPEKFARLYAKAKEQGYKLIAHAGEEGPPEYIWGALDVLQVDRVDHGVRCVEDEALVKRLIAEQVPLTVCPLSNVRLCVFNTMAEHNILEMLEQGLCVTVNSDDPTYFGGFMNENFEALADDLGMTKAQAVQLAANSFRASFLSDEEKHAFIQQLEQHAAIAA
ncbi:adenosine deaminase [Candidatus Thalassolituus haligoni]|uniref:adenosine deaminase n=1 Tax=Candidatus Thalassolituus haligoni TaxID=3100113 RepID=UPI003517D6E0|tara:strand:- start:804 stop:1820 length:1017 start_codon:yes stop_codon:yes gene_type:complete